MTTETTRRRQSTRNVAGAVVGIVAGVAILAVVVIVAVWVLGTRATTGKVEHRDTTDAEYCTVAKAIPFAQAVDAVTKQPAYLDLALGTIPNHGPAPVNDDVAKMRDQLKAGDYTGAMTTAHTIDGQTATVCP